MEIKEFEEKYYLHDSLLINYSYNSSEKTLKLLIDFCFWAQENYHHEYPETGLVNVIFYNVKNFFDDSVFPKLENLDDEILNFSINNDGKININLSRDTDDGSIAYNLSFYSESVDFNVAS